MKVGILFAGQGSQSPGMGKDFYEAYDSFKEVYDLLPEEQRRIAMEGPMEALSDTRNTQSCMVAFGMGLWQLVKEILDEEGIQPAMCAGLSLGEYTALNCAGVLSKEEALSLISIRAGAMHKAAEGVDCAMKAVLNLPREILLQCVNEASDLGICQIANYNCPGQIVIAGESKAVEKVAGLALEKGAKRCLPLAVSGPFHTTFMKPAADTLEQAFKTASFGEMKIPVVFNAIGRTKTAEESIPELLVKQVQSSVYFEDSIKLMAENGIDTFIEIGPGKALTGFVKKTLTGVKTITLNTVEDLKGLKDALKGE